jgi:glycine cleavage system transcriptional repressor
MDESRGYVVLTAVGPDRPGLVNDLSALIGAAGANIEDSRMAVLGGEFAVIMLLSGPPGAIDPAHRIPAQVESELGLRCLLKDTSPAHPPADYLLYRIDVTGVDRPGIVHAIAGIFAGRNINVASLESRLTYAPFSATPMFVLEAQLQVPSTTVLAEFRQDIAATCEEENLDFRLELA